ncbi:unnamed protein product [Oncorhynchus mykiss]|uniref:Ig-like domain-containing protein n=1 Tax=Oncorhynchus mykiss TaxID=8022 RepID=A0A060WFQ0_ONCMY|nr:unnamed protein product [Oncorhynchus mykiss]
MFPDLVKISWKMEDANGGRTEVPKAEGEQLEQREEEQTTSMIIIDKDNTYRNKYICSVEHEWGAQHLVIPKDTPTTMSAPAFRNDTQESLTLQFTEDSFQSTFIPVHMQSEPVLSGLYSDDSEEHGVLLWALSPAAPQEHDKYQWTH